MIILYTFLVGCAATTPKPSEEQSKFLVCVEEVPCKDTLAKECPRGGNLHGVTPAIVVEYSCKP